MNYIEHQFNYVDTYLSKYPVSYNGCGVIAIYNLAEYLNKKFSQEKENFRYILDWFTPKVYFKGLFGIMPWQIYQFLVKNGISNKILILSTKKLISYCENAQKNNNKTVFIVMYAEKQSAHYIFVDDKLEPHNMYGKYREWIPKESPIGLCIVFSFSVK